MTNEIVDPVKKCLRALEAAQTDTEKFATLFLVPKLVKGVDCDKNARLHLMKVRYKIIYDIENIQIIVFLLIMIYLHFSYYRESDFNFLLACFEAKTALMVALS